MSGGRINTDGKLDSWRADPTRSMIPPEPNYELDAQKYKEKLIAKREAKRKKLKEQHIKEFGRGDSTFIIKDLNFTFKYSTYKGQQLSYVVKKDPDFVRNLVKSGQYEISDVVLKNLIKRGIIKS